MGELTQDLRYAVRTLLKSPGFAAVAVLSLALGIGANTTIFSIVNLMFLRPIPVEDPSSLVAIYTSDEKNPGALPISRLNAMDIREGNQSFSDVLVYSFSGFNLKRDGGESEQLPGLLVTGNYFDVLGVRAALGRTFLPEEDRTPGSHPVVVLSHGAWMRQFGADQSIVGKTILLNNQGFTVVGVTAENFKGTDLQGQPALFVPMMMYHQVLSGTMLEWMDERRALISAAIGRLKPGVTLEQAQADIKAVAKRLEQEYPLPNGGRSATLVPLTQATIPPDFRNAAIVITAVLMFVVGLVLLIACANVANLLLARAARRRKEIAIRLSLGAGRSRLIRQLLTESTLLSVLGGALGLLLAFWVRDLLLAQFLPPEAGLTLPLDARVLMFTILVSLLTGLIFGLTPALQSTKPDVVGALKDQSGLPSGRRRVKLKSAIVAAQIALSLVALVGAGLFLRSLRNMQQIEPGFETEKLLIGFVNIGAQGYDQARAEEFYRQVRENVGALPGVQSAAWSQNGPLGWGFMRTVFLEGQDTTDRQSGVLTLVNSVGPGYFETIGVALRGGRSFTDADRQDAPFVAIVNETMAKKYWSGKDPVGQRFQFFGETQVLEVVGVARDVKYQALGEDPRAAVYMPAAQWFQAGMVLHVRSQGDPQPLIGSVRNALKSVEPALPPPDVETIGKNLEDSLQGAKTVSMLLGIFGALALGMASLGIYGVTAYSVAQRTREIGIRMALGARGSDVLRLVLGQSMALVLIGLGLGLAIALALSLALAGQLANVLVGVGAADPMAFGGTALALAAVGFVAIYVPALRATRVNPIVALKYE